MHEFNIYATCNRERRRFVFAFLEAGNTLDRDRCHFLAKKFGCDWHTIYYDACLFRGTYDDAAFDVILKQKWSEQHRRARAYGVKDTLSIDELKGLYEITGGACQECGHYIGRQYLVPDHIISMSLGGPNSVSNIRILCGMCNLQKTRKGQPPKEAIEKMDGKYITTQEAAAKLAELRNHPSPYTVRWIQSLIDRGKVIAKKFGRDWMVNEISLEAYARRKGGHGAPPQPDHVTIAEAAEVLNVSPATIYYRINTGKIKPVKINGYTYIDEKELEAN